MFIRAGWHKGEALGAKLVSIFPDNNNDPDQPLPSIQAAFVLFDGKNGQPLACLDGTALTHLKTASDSALGAKLLSRADTKSMLMVGAGAMAPHLIQAHCAVRPSIKTVYIWNRNPEKSGALSASSLQHRVGKARLIAVNDLEYHARRAELICCATASTTPVIKGEWLKAGSHLDLVGAFTPSMREADDECLKRGSLFVDARATTVKEIGELMIPIKNGVITADDVKADLFELCQKLHYGRSSSDQITVFKNGGGGHLDLMTARLVYDASKPRSKSS